jgi:predicted nucleotidyltransferase
MLDIETTKGLLINWAQKNYPRLCALAIFGSYADGTAVERSDLDLAGFIAPNASWTRGEQLSEEIDCCHDWTKELEHLLGFRKVSLVVLRLGDKGHSKVRQYLKVKRIVLFDPDKLSEL